MANNTSLTSIDELATETILEIFEYLSSNDIIYSFFDLNQRFNSILLHYQHYLKNLKNPTTNLHFWQNILPNIGSYIQDLIITTNNFSFSLNSFPNLKSICISSKLPIGYSLIYPLMQSKQFNKLESFKNESEVFYSETHYRHWTKSMWKTIFTYHNTLKIFEYLSALPSYHFEDIASLTINVHIHSLSLKSKYFSHVLSLLPYTPNLKYLNIITASIYFNESSIRNLDLSELKIEKFCLTIDNKEEYFIDLSVFQSFTNFVKKFLSSLVYLSLDLSGGCIPADNISNFNGISLERQLLKPMVKLTSFHFYFKLDHPPTNIENLLLTFKTKFWFDHDWSIGIHEQYIYTIPFHYNKLENFVDFDHIKSSNPMILNSPLSWYNIRSIDFAKSYKLNLNLIKQLIINIPKLTSINFTSSSNSSSEVIEDMDTNTTLKSVTTICFEGSFDENFQQWLINSLPNLKYLVLSNTNPTIYQKIKKLTISDVYFITEWKQPLAFYFPNLEYVRIKLLHIGPYNFMKILKTFTDCKSLMLYLCSDMYYSESTCAIDIDKMFNKLDLIEARKYYDIQHGYNCLEFTRKNNE